jgi:predicted metal-dependent hydrolase
MNADTIRLFAISKLDWIKQQRKLRAQERETPREFIGRESHYVWGKRYLLTLIEEERSPSIELKASRIVLKVRPGSDENKRQELVENWYRAQVREAATPLIDKWERRIGVSVTSF